MERSAWPKNLSSSRKQAIQELLDGQSPTKIRHLFDAHSQTCNNTAQPLIAEDLFVNVVRSSSNTLSLSSSANESYEVLQVPTNACVRSEVSEGSESINTPVLRRTPDTRTRLDQNLIDEGQESSPNDQQSIFNSQFPRKICQVEGCGKGARGASGRCISHGGGRRCQKPGCPKGAEGRTVYCKAHGGGRRCLFLGCTKSAEWRTDFCIAHGGGQRCPHDVCTRAARGKSGLCIWLGGGKRSQKENCTKSAEGPSWVCISHGGGRRCQNTGCTKGAQGSTMFCKAHGGGKRCTFVGCNKQAEGSTPLCKGHGGGKRCAFQGGGICPKSVHGGTNFCVAHGGRNEILSSFTLMKKYELKS